MEPRRPVLAYELLPNATCLVLYKAAGASLPNEWPEFFDYVESTFRYGERLRFFVYNEDGEMPREHMERVREMMQAHPLRVAVISPSPAMRFMMSIFAMWNRHVKLFAQDQHQAAFEHLGYDAETGRAILDALERGRRKTRG